MCRKHPSVTTPAAAIDVSLTLSLWGCKGGPLSESAVKQNLKAPDCHIRVPQPHPVFPVGSVDLVDEESAGHNPPMRMSHQSGL